MNFVEKLLANGFTRIVYEWEKKKGRQDAGFNPQSGWMGLITYHPYERFEKGDVVVELDLSRFGVWDFFIDSHGKTETKRVNEKRIKVSKGSELIYDSRNGVLPPLEIQNLIL